MNEPMRDSDIDSLSADGAQESHPTVYRSHIEEMAAAGGSRTTGRRVWFTDRRGQKRWRPATAEEVGGEADKS